MKTLIVSFERHATVAIFALLAVAVLLDLGGFGLGRLLGVAVVILAAMKSAPGRSHPENDVSDSVGGDSGHGGDGGA